MIVLTYRRYMKNPTPGFDEYGDYDVPCKSKRDVEVKPEDIELLKKAKYSISQKAHLSDFDERGVITSQTTLFNYRISCESNTATKLLETFVDSLSTEDIKDILLPIRHLIEHLHPKMLNGIEIDAGFDHDNDTEAISVKYYMPLFYVEDNQYLLCKRVIDLVVEKMIELYEALPD
jgi:hypothetical protein